MLSVLCTNKPIQKLNYDIGKKFIKGKVREKYNYELCC